MSYEKGHWFQWFSELNICSLSLTTLLFSIILLRSSKYDPYLQDDFNRNVNKPFINNIRLTKEKCNTTEEVANLGTWTGIPEACYCYDNKTFFPKIFENKCEKLNYPSSNYICKNVNIDIKEIKLEKYKNYTICVERSHLNYEKLFYLLNKISPQNSTLDLTNLKTVIKKEGYTPITDIKLISPELLLPNELANLKINSYEKIQDLDNNYSLYIQRKEILNIKLIERFIVDVNLYNQVWCSFLDLAPPPSSSLLKTRIDFGYEYCNNFFSNSGYSYNDLNKRFESINYKYDPLASKNDFYSYVENNTIITTYNNILLNNTKYSQYMDKSVKGMLEPSLMFEKLWPGIYCNKFMDIIEINKKYNNLNILSILATAIFISELLMIFTLACRQLCKNLEIDNYLFWSQITLFIIILSIFFMSLFYCILGKSSSSFFNKFQSECQIDTEIINVDSNKVSPLEHEMLVNIDYLTAYSLVLTVFYSMLLFYILFLILSKMDCSSIQDGAGNTKKRKSELSNMPF